MDSQINKVISMLEEFRQSDQGCAWTKAQSFATLAPQTIEEAYELAEAAELNDVDHLKTELGDILYHFLFYTLIAAEEKLFTLEDICQDIIDKHTRRMPSKEQRKTFSADDTNAYWQQLKAEERAGLDSILDGIPTNLSALTRADKLQKRAADIGFDWDHADQVMEKLEEEMDEVKVEIAAQDHEKLTSEIGDLLFTVANLARHHNIDPETALRHANRKFECRFRRMETLASERDVDFNQLDMPTSLELWDEVKRQAKTKDHP